MMRVSKDERFEELLTDVRIPKRERPHVEVEELSEAEIKIALELYRKTILSERKWQNDQFYQLFESST